MKFKEGDRIVNIGCNCHWNDNMYKPNSGKHGVVDRINSSSENGQTYHIKYDDGASGLGGKCCYELETKKTTMQKVSIMMKKLLNADIQTLVKAGYLNGDLDLTLKGQTALMVQLFESNRAELVKAAEEEIAEEEKKNQ